MILRFLIGFPTLLWRFVAGVADMAATLTGTFLKYVREG